MSHHEINIYNLKSGDTIQYSLVIIKGQVKNNKACQDDKIVVSLNCSQSSFKIIDGKFKILIELRLGENLICLKYCCTTTDLIINYFHQQAQFTVLPLYIVCKGHDGAFQAPTTEKNDTESALKRISLGSKLLQSIVAEKLLEEGQGRKTFQLEDDCRIFHSQMNYLDARKMTQSELWKAVAKEIVSSDMEHERVKFLGFLSCTRYRGENYQPHFTHDDIVKITEGYVALGGGGLALFGSACLYTWPEDVSQVLDKFEDSTPVLKNQFMDDSGYKGTLGGCFSTTLGSVLHELCHTFDLGHTKKGVMGRGFDDIYKVFVVNKEVKETNILRRQMNSIEFKEEFDSDDASRKKIVTCKNVDDEADGIFWTKSCTTLLAYHKWFNNFRTSKSTIKFDPVTNIINSTAGLRVIELRNEEDGMVLLSWIFNNKVLRYSFQLPESDLHEITKNYVILVEDNVGNILKQNVTVS